MKSRKRSARVTSPSLKWILAIAGCLIAAAAFSLRVTMAQVADPTAANPIAADEDALPGHPPRLVTDGTALLVAPFASDQKLRLVIGLTPPHLQDEEKFVQDLQTKGSPQFHHFLTADQWNQRFAPAVKDEQAVVDWANSQGLTVTHRYPNRLLVDLEAPVSVIQNALGVRINSYKVNSETVFSNDSPPAIPPALSGIVHSVEGLNNIERMHGSMKGAGSVSLPVYVPGPVVAQGEAFHADGDARKLPVSLKAQNRDHSISSEPNITNGLYDPSDIYGSNAYDFNALQALGHCCNPLGNAGSSPPDASIALATYGDVNFSDVAGFQSQYSYLAYNIQKISIDGGPPSCVVTPTNGCGANAETTLDTEWSMATSNDFGGYQNTAKIFVYESSGSATDMYNQMLTDGNARVFSTSWSCTETYGCSGSTMDTRHAIFNSMLGQGWTLMTASGDRGATDDCAHTSVSYPASDPDVVGVGGTLLSLFSDSTYDSEVAWTGGTYAGACSQNNGGSGGGCSSHFSAPGFQSNQPCGSGSRAVPDISLNSAGGQNYYFNGSLRGVGGTSIASPEMAGFFAQVNAYLLYIGSLTGNSCGSFHVSCSPIGNGNTYLYYFGINPNYAPHYPFYDITSGCNSDDITSALSLGYYCSGTGYDEVTGWGSANALQLAWAINTYVAGDFGAPSVAFSGPATGQWYNTDQTVNWTVTDTTANGGNPNGVSGFSQAWDLDPGDVSKEPTPGQGNSFYNGPQFPNATSGFLSLSGAGGQGCHTVNVRTWDNSGVSGNSTYGSLCYDTVAPITSSSAAPLANLLGWNRTTVKVTLNSSDPFPGSGVTNTYFSVDGSFCSSGFLFACATYSGPISVTTQAKHTIYYFSKDVAGNFQPRQTRAVNIDETPPHTTVALAGTINGTNYLSTVKVTLGATDSLSGVAGSYYQVDGGATTHYTAPFNVTGNGSHTVTFHSLDNAGNTEANESSSFTIQEWSAISLASSLNPSTYGKAVTFTAKLVPSGAGTPTGTITFKDGGSSLGVAVLSGAKATFTTSALSGGVHQITGVYSGDAAFAAHTSAVLPQTVNRLATTTALAASLGATSFNQLVTFTASVTSTLGVPTGTVTFKNGAATLGSPALAAGKAVLSISTLTVGVHSITAVYNGDTNHSPSTSPGVSHTVNKGATSTALLASVNPSVFNQAVTFTVTVTPSTSGVPTGTVTFKNGAATLGSPALAAGKAVLSISTLAVGVHSITAVYNGDTNHSPSTSPGVSHTVNKGATSTALLASVNPSVFNQAVTFTATVTPSTSGVPTGTVTFKNGAATLGSPALAAGKAVLSISTLAVGAHSITAVYNGDTNHSPSTSPGVSHTVNKGATSTALLASVNPSVFNQAVTFTATVTPSTSGVPTGTVTFKNGAATLGSPALAAGKAVLSISTLAVGAHSITAVYNGDANHSPSTSPGVSHTVNKAATSTALVSSLNPSTVNTAVTFTATVTPATGGVPTGAVTFKAGATTLGSPALSAGKATLSTSTLAKGNNTITAVYGGSVNLLGSTSPALIQVVK